MIIIHSLWALLLLSIPILALFTLIGMLIENSHTRRSLKVTRDDLHFAIREQHEWRSGGAGG